MHAARSASPTARATSSACATWRAPRARRTSPARPPRLLMPRALTQRRASGRHSMPESTLLWEVGCEEMPSWACDQVLRQLPALVQQLLERERLAAGTEVTAWAGPRRFAVTTRVNSIQEAQE